MLLLDNLEEEEQKRLLKKLNWKGDSGIGRAGAKAEIIFAAFMARLKPCPCYKAGAVEFIGKL
jgi:hypothetical protein